jgi:hypothetical protein
MAGGRGALCLENTPLPLANNCLAGVVPTSTIELRPSVAYLGRVISTEAVAELLIRLTTTPDVSTGSPRGCFRGHLLPLRTYGVGVLIFASLKLGHHPAELIASSSVRPTSSRLAVSAS